MTTLETNHTVLHLKGRTSGRKWYEPEYYMFVISQRPMLLIIRCAARTSGPKSEPRCNLPQNSLMLRKEKLDAHKTKKKVKVARFLQENNDEQITVVDLV